MHRKIGWLVFLLFLVQISEVTEVSGTTQIYQITFEECINPDFLSENRGPNRTIDDCLKMAGSVQNISTCGKIEGDLSKSRCYRVAAFSTNNMELREETLDVSACREAITNKLDQQKRADILSLVFVLLAYFLPLGLFGFLILFSILWFARKKESVEWSRFFSLNFDKLMIFLVVFTFFP